MSITVIGDGEDGFVTLKVSQTTLQESNYDIQVENPAYISFPGWEGWVT